ncbi:MAG: hypothetical protein M1818_007259 [Claussenomyces sp. TS43310]|nr:MAG: hypothetical protein M1818_007259 [Claussenomyces sp. TS43310]
MSHRAISSAIRTLDLVPEDECLTVGPFGVFPMRMDPPISCQTTPLSGISTFIRSDLSDVEVKASNKEKQTQNELGPFEVLDTDIEEIGTDLISVTPGDAIVRLEPSLYDCWPIKCRDERKLMHYWITFLCPLMIPIESQENPFRTVLVPLALSAAYDYGFSAGNSALLHSIYALAAIWGANLRHAEQNQRILGARHLQLSLQYLGFSISGNYNGFPEVILAAITTLVLIGIFNGDSTPWRIHLRGAFIWLQSIDRSVWQGNHHASAIYQIFLCLDALRPAHRTLALELEPHDLCLDNGTMDERVQYQGSYLNDDSLMICSDTDYCLDTIFCIPQPLLKAIIQINNWVYIGRRPPANELESLELRIIFNNPDGMQPPYPATVSEKMKRHYACLWYVATYLYFNRSLQKLPLCNVQHLVRQSIEHLDAIALLELGQNVSGIMWPAFIAGCDAINADLRDRVDAYFDKREALGVGNVAEARAVVREVWRRRDEVSGLVDVYWHEVMMDLGINIMLS